MTILAFKATIGTLPSPSVSLILHGVQEKLASDDRVLGHVFRAFTRVSVEVNLLGVFSQRFAFLTLQALRTCEERRK